MNRSRFIRRLFRDEMGNLVRDVEGDQAAQAEALALATDHSAEFIGALRRHLAAVDEFGGSLFIAASRVKVNSRGEVVEHDDPGTYVTAGWAINYSKKSRLKGQPDELDSDLSAVENVPEPDPSPPIPDPDDLGPDPEQNGVGEPVAVES